MRAHPLLLSAALLAAFAPIAGARGDTGEALARGDDAWARRAEGHDGEGHARLEPIREAIAAYERARDADPAALEPHWKLVRALHFAGEFAAREETAKRDLFDRAAEASRAAFAALDARLAGDASLEATQPDAVAGLFAPGARPAVARIHFWSAIAWGARASVRGLVSAVRSRVAERLHRYALVTIALEPGLERGGAYRLLGRLHATLPRIPFLSGWVDRGRALPRLEQALEIAPEHPGNRLLYALTLLDLAPEREAEAVALLKEVARLEPEPDEIVEQLAMRETARERLAERESAPTSLRPGAAWATIASIVSDPERTRSGARSGSRR